jgi:hypothetical protein
MYFLRWLVMQLFICGKKYLERKLLIGNKHDKKIYVIEKFIINILWKEIIIYLWVHVWARFDVGEKKIIFNSITFQKS